MIKHALWPSARLSVAVNFGSLRGLVDGARLAQIQKDAAEICDLALAKKTKSKYLRSIQSALVKAGGSEKFLPVDSVEKVIAMFTPLKGQKFAKVTALKSALKAYHRAMAWPSPPLDRDSLHYFWEGLQKTCCNIVQGACALENDQMLGLIKYWRSRESLVNRRNAALAVLQFYGMCRVGEILMLTRNDIIKRSKGIDLRIRRAKNDRFGQGVIKFLPEKTDQGLPLLEIIEAFLKDTEPLGSMTPLFRASRGSGATSWQMSNPVLPLTAWNQTLKETMERLGLAREDQRISSHSLRKGGFTRSHEVGIQLQDAINILGHKSSTAWVAYSKQRPDKYRQAVARL